MRGRVGRRGKTWFYVVDVGHQNGKRLQRWEGGFPTRRAAEDALSKIVGDVREGGYVSPTMQTVGQFMDEWLEAMRSTVRPSTLRSYQVNIETHVKPALGPIKLQALTPGSLNGMYADLRARLSPRTIRYIYAILRKALSDGVRWNRLSRNVAQLSDPPSITAARAPEMKTWNRDQLLAFLEFARSDRQYPALVLLATTGMRRGEALGLRWADVDLEARRLAVRQTLLAVNHKIIFSEPKTRRSRRSIALDPVTLAALKDHRKRQLEERLKWGEAYQGGDLVFAKENGEPANPDVFSKHFDKLIRRAGLPDIRVHDLRHTYASLALQAGVHPKIVSDRLGHSTIALTMDTYSHAIPALEEEAADKVAALIFGG